MKKSAVILGVAVGLSALVSVSSKRAELAEAAPAAPKKVTICHRTHATTNPYVRITVSESSISNAANKHGGSKHDQYPQGSSKPSPNVFNPAINYASNQKKWGDIIPNVYTDGSAFTAAGSSTNFTGIGVLIWNGTAPYTDTCKAMSARDLYELEKANGVPESEILEDLEESGADEFATQLSACGGSFIGCAVEKLGTPTATSSTTTVAGATSTTVAGATGTTVAGSPGTTTPSRGTLPAGTTLRAGLGALEVRIWLDGNRDGNRGAAELLLGGISVTLTGPGGETVTKKTDENGYVLFNDLTPGKWTVKPTLPSGGLEKVFDSDGTPNWDLIGDVLEGQVTSTSFAAAGNATITVNTPTEDLRIRWSGKDGKFGTNDDLTFTARSISGSFTFKSLPAGGYQVTTASAFNVASAIKSVSVKKGGAAEVEIEALPATGANRVNFWMAIGIVLLGFGAVIRRRSFVTT